MRIFSLIWPVLNKLVLRNSRPHHLRALGNLHAPSLFTSTIWENIQYRTLPLGKPYWCLVCEVFLVFFNSMASPFSVANTVLTFVTLLHRMLCNYLHQSQILSWSLCSYNQIHWPGHRARDMLLGAKLPRSSHAEHYRLRRSRDRRTSWLNLRYWGVTCQRGEDFLWFHPAQEHDRPQGVFWLSRRPVRTTGCHL